MSICVGIAGGTGAGKSTLARRIADRFPGRAVVIEHDRYYRDQRHLTFDQRLATDYDHPHALETDLLVAHLKRLLAGEAVQAPVYDFVQHVRSAETRRIEPAQVIILEGLHVLGDPSLRELMAVKVYVDLDADLRFDRRLQRDVAERGRTVESVTRQYVEQVRPMHEAFVEPTKQYADIVLSGKGSDERGLDRIVLEMCMQLG